MQCSDNTRTFVSNKDPARLAHFVSMFPFTSIFSNTAPFTVQYWERRKEMRTLAQIMLIC